MNLKEFKAQIVAQYFDLFEAFNYVKAKGQGRRVIHSHYARVNNFGDQFNKDLVRFFNAELIYTSNPNKSEMALTGSILGSYPREFSGYILGAGFIAARYNRKTNKWIIKILRGPLSAEQCNAPKDVVYGDPGILASKVYTERPQKQFKIGIVPHSKDYDFVKSLGFGEDVLLIHPRRKPQAVAMDILKCQNIASSSLHGLIFSDSFGIPNIHLKFGENLIGGLHKFDDYYYGMDTTPDVLYFDNALKIDDIMGKCKQRFSKEYIQDKQEAIISIYESIIN